MNFKTDIISEDWRFSMIVPLNKNKRKRTECKNYRGISLLSVAGKIYVGILVDIVHRVLEGLTEDEQKDFKVGRCCMDQIFTLNEKVQEKKCRIYIGFMDLEKVYDIVNREVL